jgi:hypothetical protein
MNAAFVGRSGEADIEVVGETGNHRIVFADHLIKSEEFLILNFFTRNGMLSVSFMSAPITSNPVS